MNIEATDIAHAVEIAGLSGYTGTYKELGGGEINDTFKLELEDRSVILRIAKYEDQISLHREARALGQVHSEAVPQLIFFDKNERLRGRMWILESYIPGESVERLNVAQFRSFGMLLAEVHASYTENRKRHLWEELLSNCGEFGDEDFFLQHPDQELRDLITRMQAYCNEWQHKIEDVPSVLVHGDATPSNILVQGDTVALIDWELCGYRDAMSEFSTVFYEDMEYNQGKWRIQIEPEEKESLFAGYREKGGDIDEERVKLWMNHDKMGAAIFLYWRIHDSGRDADDAQMGQYQLDLDNLKASLDRNLD
jgi:aminoglycoside phosphotransferase (APT) family kinase protein